MQIAFGLLIVVIMWGGVLAYLPLQIYSAFSLTNWWRGAALLPLLVMVPVAVLTAQAYKEQSNLWPILLIFASPVAAAYLLVVIVLSRANARSRAGQLPNDQQT